MYTHEKSLCCYGSFICEVLKNFKSVHCQGEKMEADKMFL